MSSGRRRDTFAKLQRERARMAKAAEKRERRQRRNTERTDTDVQEETAPEPRTGE